jgi:hypothetical protein
MAAAGAASSQFTLNVRVTECGSSMDGRINTCFFNSLKHGLLATHPLKSATLAQFFELGGWPLARLGTMVDTDTDSNNIEMLASCLGIRIVMTNEVDTGVIIPEKVRVFGSSGTCVGIVKIHECKHFRYFTGDYTLILASETNSQTSRLREVSIKDAEQIKSDEALARLLARLYV